MSDKPSNREEHKFDTLGLLAGLSREAAEEFSLDEILNEFGGHASGKKDTGGEAQPEAAAARPVEAGSEQKEEPQPAPTREGAEKTEKADEKDAIIDQIQHAIDREMELNMATPEPVIQLEEEPEEQEEDLGDPELNALFRDKKIRLVQQTPEDVTTPAKGIPEKEEEPERHKKEMPRREKRPRLEVVKEPEPVPEASVLLKKTARAIRPARSRMTAVLILTLAAILWTAANQFAWSDAVAIANSKVASKVLLGIMALCALLSADILADGVRGIFTLKFTANSLVTLIFLVAAVDAALCEEGQRMPFCAGGLPPALLRGLGRHAEAGGDPPGPETPAKAGAAAGGG